MFGAAACVIAACQAPTAEQPGEVPRSDAGDARSPDANPPAVEAGPDAETRDAADADAYNAQCNSITHEGLDVEMVFAPNETLSFAGGAFADGTYVLTEVTQYATMPPFQGTQAYGRETLTIEAGVLQAYYTYPDGVEARFTARLLPNGESLTMTTSCAWSTTPSRTDPDWSALVTRGGQYTATPTEVRMGTPLGNHAKRVRVFAKRP